MHSLKMIIAVIQDVKTQSQRGTEREEGRRKERDRERKVGGKEREIDRDR